MLQTEQSGEEDATGQKTAFRVTRQDHGQDENAIQESIVLEVDVIDDQQAWREEDGECSGVGLAFRGFRGGLDVSV